MPAPQLLLASRSPRRAELLTRIGIRFAAIPATIDECRRSGEAPESYVRRLALEKGRAGQAEALAETPLPVLAADTAVVLDDRILGKPRDREEAAWMLSHLSGRDHQVLTAVALLTHAQDALALSRSAVCFRTLRADEIAAYWLTGEPQDAAGGYAIQGYGALFVTHLAGSHSGVMGLPLYETGCLLEAAGIRPLAAAS